MKKYSLSEYVKFRNGVSLGAKGSMSNMLRKSLGAGSIKEFWKYWNPIWGYYLSKFIYQPSSKYIPTTLAIIITFLVSGLLHDLAVFLIKGRFSFALTLTFLFFSMGLVLSELFKINYSNLSVPIRMLIHIIYLTTCVSLTLFIMSY